MNPVVAGYFEVLREDLKASRELAASVPRVSAYHLQQSAEKLVKAILAAEGIHVGVEHSIGQLLAKLPDGHEWKVELVSLDYLSQFATTFRYPTAAGRVPSPPESKVLDHYATLTAGYADEVAAWCEEKA